MATLTGQQIDLSYQGLIKTSDNAALSATAKGIQDGTGGATNIEMSNTATNFVSGTVDFTGSTVSGLPAAAAGLESGTGTNAMQSAASLTATAANASGNNSIALGEGAAASAEGGVAVGENTTADGTDSVAIGRGANSNSESVAIGDGSTNASSRSVAIGRSASAQQNSLALGNFAGANATTSISLATCSIGGNSNSAPNGVMIVPGPYGGSANAAASNAIVIGEGGNVERATANAVNGIAIGSDAITDGSGAVAIGNGVTATTADTVSVKALETQTNGGVKIKGDGTNAGKLSLFCEDASGAHNVTLEGPAHAGGSTYALKFPNVQSTGTQILEADASGNLAWINTPSGGGGAAGLVNGTGTDTLKSAASLTTTAAVASGNYSIALGEGASATRQESVAIGQNAAANGSGSEGSIAIGAGSVASANRGIAIGINGTTNSSEGIVIGDDVDISSSDRSVGIGNSINLSGGSDKVAIGTSASVAGNRGLAFGQNASATANEAIAIGYNVTAANAQTLSVKALETQTDSTPTAGGIIMSDAGGTDRRLNITSSGALQVDSNAVGAPTQFELPKFTVPNSATSDIVYSVVTIPANTFAVGDILEFRAYEDRLSLNNTCYESYWFSEQSQTVGQPTATSGTAKQQAGIQSSSNGTTYYQKTLFIGATGTAVYVYGTPNETANASVRSGDPIETQVIDWTTTQYFYYQAWNDSTAGSVINYGTILRKIN